MRQFYLCQILSYVNQSSWPVRVRLALTGHDDWVRSAIYSPDGQRIVTGFGEDKTAKVWDASTVKAILPERLPSQTQLLADYPNPFNPETWIPCQLSQDAEVRLTIYDVTGKIVRKMELGHLTAGNYSQIEKAIYWDDQTETGSRWAQALTSINCKQVIIPKPERWQS